MISTACIPFRKGVQIVLHDEGWIVLNCGGTVCLCCEGLVSLFCGGTVRLYCRGMVLLYCVETVLLYCRGGGVAVTITIPLSPQLVEGFVESPLKWVCVRDDVKLGFYETVDGGGGQGEGAEELNGFVEGGNLATHFDAAANVDAQHVDLVFEASKLTFIEVFSI